LEHYVVLSRVDRERLSVGPLRERLAIHDNTHRAEVGSVSIFGCQYYRRQLCIHTGEALKALVADGPGTDRFGTPREFRMRVAKFGVALAGLSTLASYCAPMRDGLFGAIR
jgi:hypothetical protein